MPTNDAFPGFFRWSRSSSREVRIRIPFFSVVYFSHGEPSLKKRNGKSWHQSLGALVVQDSVHLWVHKIRSTRLSEVSSIPSCATFRPPVPPSSLKSHAFPRKLPTVRVLLAGHADNVVFFHAHRYGHPIPLNYVPWLAVFDLWRNGI